MAGILSSLQRRRSFSFVSVALYGAAWMICLAPFAVQGLLPGPPTADTNVCFIPYRAYLLRMLWSGHFPDLAEGMFFGQPMMTYGQPMLLYPTQLLGLVTALPHRWFFLGDLWIHAVAASVGCAWLLRRRGASPLAALALGWVYPNSTAFLFRAYGHWTMLHQAALVPWIFWAWEGTGRMRRGREFVRLAALAALFALLLMNRTPHWPYLLALILIPLEAARMVRRRRWVSMGRRAVVLAAAAVAAILLAAADVFPPLIGYRDSFRAVAAEVGLSRFWPLSPVNLLALISPYGFFGGSPARFFGNWWAVESVAVVGRVVALSAGVGLVALLLRPKRFLLKGTLPILCIVVGVVFGIGGDVESLRAILHSFPLFDALRAWGRASLYIVVGLILFAGSGFDALFGRGARAKSAPLALAALSGLAMVALLYIRARLGQGLGQAGAFLIGLGWHMDHFRAGPAAVSKMFQAMRGHMAVDVLWYGVCGVLGLVLFVFRIRGRLGFRRVAGVVAGIVIAAEAFLFQRFVFSQRMEPLVAEAYPKLAGQLREMRDREAPEPVTIGMASPELFNFALQFGGIRNPYGVDSNMRANYAEWLNAVEGLPRETGQFETRISSFPPELLDVTGLSAIVERDLSTTETASPHRAGPYRVIENLKRRPYAEIEGGGGSASRADSGVEVVEWRDGFARLRVRSPTPAVVRIREFPDSRWHVRVNGRRQPTEWRGDLMAVEVPAGGGEVRIVYIDRVSRAFVGVSLVAWMGLWVAMAMRRWRRRAREARPA